MIQIYSNSLGREELDVIGSVFESKWLGLGKECAELEKELAALWNINDVLLLNNCTAGIYIALRTIGIGAGDEVIISSVNFVACANAVIEFGAVPVFADVDMEYFNILPSEIERLKTNRTKAVIILHYGGHSADFDAIRDVCGTIPIIEDSANSIVSTYKGKYCGTIGDIGVCSFDAMKILVMGDGGTLVTGNEDYLAKAKVLRYLGFPLKTSSGADSAKNNAKKWWEFDVSYPSGRFISNDILASIGRVQLKKLPSFIERRKEVWDTYKTELKGVMLPPEPLLNTTSSYYMFWIRTGKRDELARHLLDNDIYSTYRYYPLHMVKGYGSNQRLPNAETVNDTALNIPLHQNVSNNDLEKIITTINGFFK